MRVAWQRVVDNLLRGNRARTNWLYCVAKVLREYLKEGRTLAVELRRREWGRLGGLLKRHPWVARYRNKHFFPVWYKRVVKRWLEQAGGRRMY